MINVESFSYAIAIGRHDQLNIIIIILIKYHFNELAQPIKDNAFKVDRIGDASNCFPAFRIIKSKIEHETTNILNPTLLVIETSNQKLTQKKKKSLKTFDFFRISRL